MTRCEGIWTAVLAATAATILPLSQSQAQDDRPYTGEASYEKMCGLWPPITRLNTVLGAKHCRTKFEVLTTGAILASWVKLSDPAQQDHKGYAPYEMTLDFGTGSPPYFETHDKGMVHQRLLNGYLPILESKWRNGDVEYSVLAYAMLFEAERVVTGSETAVALLRLRMRNTTDQPTSGHFWTQIEARIAPRWKDGIVFDDQERIRMIVETPPTVSVTYRDRYAPDTDKENYQWVVVQKKLHQVLRCEAHVPPGESVDMHVKLPYFPVPLAKETALRDLDFKSNMDRVVADWEQELSRGMKIETPDRAVNEMYKSNLMRMFITPDKDPTTGLVHLKSLPTQRHVGSFDYFYEGCALDQRGYHKEVAKYLETAMAWQGTNKPLGNFTSTEGCLVAHPAFEANAHVPKNGYALWAFCEHYRLTQDREWLDRATPNVLASCDWIIRERTSTKKLDPEGNRPIEYGLLPKGPAEDYWSRDWNGTEDNWVASDAFNYLGLATAAEILTATGHPRGEELEREAADYRECIRRAVKTAVARAAKLRFPNGDLVPWVPDEIHARTLWSDEGRIYGKDRGGWERMCLYVQHPPLTLVTGKVFDPNEDEMTWALRFEEEYPLNLFFPGVVDPRPLLTYGASPVIALFDTQIDCYFWRDEIPKFVEAFYSMMAGTLSRSTYAGVDHPYYAGRAMCAMRDGMMSKLVRQMLIQEDGKDILLAWATPKAWLEDGKRINVKDACTRFGPMAFEIVSHAKSGTIEATIDPPKRNPPSGMKLKLRLRHPNDRPIKRATVNGQEWGEFTKDTIVTPGAGSRSVAVTAHY